MEQRSAVSLTSAGCFAAIILVIAAISEYVPFFRFFGLIIIPLPLLLMYMKFSFRYAMLTAVAAIVLMVFTLGPVVAFIEGLTCLVGIAIGLGFKKQWNSTKLLIAVTIALVVLWSAVMAVTFVVTGINPIMDLLQAMYAVVDQMVQAQQGQLDPVELMKYKAEMENFKLLLPSLLPFLLCLAMAVFGYANIKLSQVVLKRLGIEVKPFLPIRYWEIPHSMIYLYVLGMVMKYWGTTRNIDGLTSIGLNFYMIAYFFICAAGLAFVFAILHQRVKLRTSVQVLLAVVLFFFPPLAMMLFFLGLFDMLLQYRKKHDMV